VLPGGRTWRDAQVQGYETEDPARLREGRYFTGTAPLGSLECDGLCIDDGRLTMLRWKRVAQVGLAICIHGRLSMPLAEGDCPNDDHREDSDDARVGRFNSEDGSSPSCTVWLASNGALVTAGHCIPDDDFEARWVEFNVPSCRDGNGGDPVDEEDRYRVKDLSELGCLTFAEHGCTPGRDWALFARCPCDGV